MPTNSSASSRSARTVSTAPHAFDPESWVIKESARGFRIWVSLAEEAISRPILRDRYEPAEAAFMAAVVRPGDVAVDAGANVGIHTLLLAALVGESGTVHAFEPVPYLAAALAASLRENATGERVRLHEVALDELAGTTLFRYAVHTANFGGAHLAPKAVAQPHEVDIPVVRTRLDDVIGEGRCAFIKLDVEGAEPRVLNGARALLERERPAILSELHDAQLRLVSGIGAAEFIAVMRELGYRCRRLTRKGEPGHELSNFAGGPPTSVVFLPE